MSSALQMTGQPNQHALDALAVCVGATEDEA